MTFKLTKEAGVPEGATTLFQTMLRIANNHDLDEITMAASNLAAFFFVETVRSSDMTEVQSKAWIDDCLKKMRASIDRHLAGELPPGGIPVNTTTN
ncbi:MAG: hypothetical protein JSS57_07245 [Proteobacteria bacterium]|nr:hypothetical protein [Pseudomonadota bacterium]